MQNENVHSVSYSEKWATGGLLPTHRSASECPGEGPRLRARLCVQVKKDFTCRLDVLLRHMKYFETYLVDAPSTSDIDISVRRGAPNGEESVHCMLYAASRYFIK